MCSTRLNRGFSKVIDGNPYLSSMPIVSHPVVEVVEWCTFAWPSRRRKRVLRFRLPRRAGLRYEVVEFFAGRYCTLESQSDLELCFVRQFRRVSFNPLRRVIPGYRIRVMLDLMSVTCEYTPTALNIFDRSSAKWYGPIAEVQLLADYCNLLVVDDQKLVRPKASCRLVS